MYIVLFYTKNSLLKIKLVITQKKTENENLTEIIMCYMD